MNPDLNDQSPPSTLAKTWKLDGLFWRSSRETGVIETRGVASANEAM